MRQSSVPVSFFTASRQSKEAPRQARPTTPPAPPITLPPQQQAGKPQCSSTQPQPEPSLRHHSASASSSSCVALRASLSFSASASPPLDRQARFVKSRSLRLGCWCCRSQECSFLVRIEGCSFRRFSRATSHRSWTQRRGLRVHGWLAHRLEKGEYRERVAYPR